MFRAVTNITINDFTISGVIIDDDYLDISFDGEMLCYVLPKYMRINRYFKYWSELKKTLELKTNNCVVDLMVVSLSNLKYINPPFKLDCVISDVYNTGVRYIRFDKFKHEEDQFRIITINKNKYLKYLEVPPSKYTYTVSSGIIHVAGVYKIMNIDDKTSLIV